MKTKILRLSIILFLFVLLGCHGIADSPGCAPIISTNSYIQFFTELEGTIHVRNLTGIQIDHTIKTIMDKRHLPPPTSPLLPKDVVMEIDPWGKDLIFEDAPAHTESIGDKNCKYEHRYSWKGCYIHAIVDTLSSISITCKQDFGEKYPAGSDISALFFVCFEHPYLVVKNGYKNYEGPDAYNLNDIYKKLPHAMIGGNLKTMNFSDRPYIGDAWICQLQQAPDNTGEYSFDVTVTTTEGKRLSATSKPFRIKGSNN